MRQNRKKFGLAFAYKVWGVLAFSVVVAAHARAESFPSLSDPSYKAGETPGLVTFKLSPEAPRQGDTLTVFIQTEPRFGSPDRVKTILHATLDGASADADLLHPAERLWILRVGPLNTVATHELAVETLIEDLAQSGQIRQALTGLNREILDLTAAIGGESDPARKAVLQAQLEQENAQRDGLQSALSALKQSVGTDRLDFAVSANADSPDFPHVSGVTPNVLVQGKTAVVTIIGSGFTPGCNVLIGNRPAQTGAVSAGRIAATVPSDLPLGALDVEVVLQSAAGPVTNAILPSGIFVTAQLPPQQTRPVAYAGVPQIDQMIRHRVQLDGSQSYGGNGLTYLWHILSKPDASSLTDSSLIPATVPLSVFFTPDAAGTYVFSLVVSDGVQDSLPSLTTVAVAPPKYIGISFWAKSGLATVPPFFLFSIADRNTLEPGHGIPVNCNAENGGCDNHFSVPIALTQQWTQYVVRFSDLMQDPNWGYHPPGGFEPWSVNKIIWGVLGSGEWYKGQQCTGGDGPFDVWIDDVRLVNNEGVASTQISDLENGSARLPLIEGRNGSWWSYTDGTGTLWPPNGSIPPIAGGAPQSPLYAARYYGTGHTSWGADLGITFCNPDCYYDLLYGAPDQILK